MTGIFTNLQRRLTNMTKSSKSSKQSTGPDDNTDSSQSSATSSNSPAYLTYDTHTNLINLAALLDSHTHTPDPYETAYFSRINAAVRDAPNSTHSYAHVVRIVMATRRIYLAEQHHALARDIDVVSMYVAALISGLGDVDVDVRSTTAEQDKGSQDAQWNALRDVLDAAKVPPLVAGTASYIASFISFSREVNNAGPIEVAMEKFPALKIVQDAYRVSEMGTVGIVRAKDGEEWLKGMDGRYGKYVGLMKTTTGRTEAEKAWELMQDFREKLLAEVECEIVLDAEDGVRLEVV